jgi:hypothetical protein
MPAAGPSLASGRAAGEVSPGCSRQSPRFPGRESAPSAGERRVSDRCKARNCTGAWSRSELFSHFCYATVRAATNSQPAQSATMRGNAAATAGWLFATSLIANTSGFLAALWLEVRSGPFSIKPPASGTSHGKPVPPTRYRRDYLPTEGHSSARRSSIIACRLAARLGWIRRSRIPFQEPN